MGCWVELIYTCIEARKEQDEKNAKDKEIEELKKRLEALENRLVSKVK